MFPFVHNSHVCEYLYRKVYNRVSAALASRSIFTGVNVLSFIYAHVCICSLRFPVRPSWTLADVSVKQGPTRQLSLTEPRPPGRAGFQ